MVAAGRLRGDEDDDDTREENVPLDSDIDRDSDAKDLAHKGYYDSDDGMIRRFGHAASASERRAIVGLIERYYAAAAAADGPAACALTFSLLVESLPMTYGQAPGPAYLRGLKTCPAILNVLLEHEHSQFVLPFEVTAVRVRRRFAYALLGSTAMPASVMELRRERGVWKIGRLVAGPLP